MEKIVTDKQYPKISKCTSGYVEIEAFNFWDESTHKILFMRMANVLNPFTFQVYKGYMFLVSEINSSGVLFCYSTFAGEFLTPKE